GLPALRADQTSRRSSGLLLLSDAPASPARVGYMSTTWIGWSTFDPGTMWPGQLASATTRVPPSYSVPLPSRYRPLSAGMVLLDMSISPVNFAERGPPLSLWKTMSVLSRILRRSSAAITRPISSSMAVIIAAYARRLGSAISLYLSRYSLGA